MKIFSTIVVVLCAAAPIMAITCDKLLREFAQKSSLYIQCNINHGVPFSICHDCSTEYNEFKESYDVLKTTKAPDNTTYCSDIYFNKDKLNIVPHSFEILDNYWNQAFCNECFNDDRTTINNETNSFYQLVTNYKACQTLKKDFCETCKGQYNDLNNMFIDIEEEHKHSVCFDITDVMNRTRAEWTKTCGHETPSGSLLAFAAVSSTLTSLPILFYIGFFLYYRRVEQNYQTLDSQSEAERETTTRNEDPPTTSEENRLGLPSTSAGVTAETSTNSAHNKVKNIIDEEHDLLS